MARKTPFGSPPEPSQSNMQGGAGGILVVLLLVCKQWKKETIA